MGAARRVEGIAQPVGLDAPQQAQGAVGCQVPRHQVEDLGPDCVHLLPGGGGRRCVDARAGDGLDVDLVGSVEGGRGVGAGERPQHVPPAAQYDRLRDVHDRQAP